MNFNLTNTFYNNSKVLSDIAGSSWIDKKKNNFIKGGTGAGTRMLFHLARQFSSIK